MEDIVCVCVCAPHVCTCTVAVTSHYGRVWVLSANPETTEPPAAACGLQDDFLLQLCTKCMIAVAGGKRCFWQWVGV